MTREEAREAVREAYAYGDPEYANEIIKALEQEPDLDKIRAEIEDLDVFYDNDYFSSNRDAMFKRNEVLAIIDKYKAESEVRYADSN